MHKEVASSKPTISKRQATVWEAVIKLGEEVTSENFHRTGTELKLQVAPSDYRTLQSRGFMTRADDSELKDHQFGARWKLNRSIEYNVVPTRVIKRRKKGHGKRGTNPASHKTGPHRYGDSTRVHLGSLLTDPFLWEDDRVWFIVEIRSHKRRNGLTTSGVRMWERDGFVKERPDISPPQNKKRSKVFQVFVDKIREYLSQYEKSSESVAAAGQPELVSVAPNQGLAPGFSLAVKVLNLTRELAENYPELADPEVRSFFNEQLSQNLKGE